MPTSGRNRGNGDRHRRRVDGGGVSPQDSDVCMSLAMLAVRNAPTLEKASLAAAWAECWSGEDKPARFVQDEGSLGFELAGCFVTLQVMPGPIPQADVDTVCERSWMWPEAAESMAAHRAHVIVHVMAKDKTPLEAAAVLTRVMAVLVTATDAVGVYWGEAGMVVEPRMFAERAAEAFGEGSLPLELWINVLVSHDRAGTSVTTHGLESLGFKEFEVVDSKAGPEDALEFVGGVCDYVLERQATLQHGETIGFSATQKIRMEHRESAFTPGQDVIRLML